MQIGIGQVFRVSSAEVGASGYLDYVRLTRGRHSTGADVNKGIWAYKRVTHARTETRRPAILLLSNRLEVGRTSNPWIDVIEPDSGFALYHGDNRTPGRHPFQARGNAILLGLYSLYFEPNTRALAPPILAFDQAEIDGKKKGFRRFAGYGVPRAYGLQTQATADGSKRFTNLAVELVLFGLEAESGLFDWGWIDARRDPSLSTEDALRLAPQAWRQWVKDGEYALERCRRRVLLRGVESRTSQLNLSADERDLLDRLVSRYHHNRHQFEGLASLVARRVVGSRCERGWVTKRSGDGGIDFVSKFDVGSGFSQTSAVVLGQAKCVAPMSAIGGKDLARVVARLRRGWIGVYVTTGYFSEPAQAELREDQYPLVLINGKRLANEVRKELAEGGLTLGALLDREDNWYRANMQQLEAARILTDAHARAQLPEVDIADA